MRVIGLAGGIGTGKSTVAGFLREFGACCLDLDIIGHQVMRAGTVTHRRLVESFGSSIVGEDGEINRSRLGQVVFSDDKALTLLNCIVHPAIDEIVAQTRKECVLNNNPVLVLEAAAMLENRRQWQADEIWITVAPENVVLERLKQRSGYSREQAIARIRAQMPDAERRTLADVIIDTNCTLPELRVRIAEAWQQLLERLS